MTTANDLSVRRALENAGVEFIDENGGGPGVRLRKSGKKKGRTNKAIGQCCAINDAFCLTEIAGYANICAWNGSRAAVGNQQEQGGRAAHARRLGRPQRWRP